MKGLPAVPLPVIGGVTAGAGVPPVRVPRPEYVQAPTDGCAMFLSGSASYAAPVTGAFGALVTVQLLPHLSAPLVSATPPTTLTDVAEKVAPPLLLKAWLVLESSTTPQLAWTLEVPPLTVMAPSFAGFRA